MPEIMTMTAEHLQRIVENSNFDELIGEVENAEFECKAEPYLTTTEHGKRELAKDVSAFANAGGGYIFIGVKTKQSTDHFGDEIEAIRPFLPSLVNTSQYIDILRAWVFPDISRLEVSWKPTTNDATRGVVVIKIPNQNPGTKPFLITKTLDEKKHVETVFGYVQRKGDKNPPLEVKELQALLRSGIHYQEKIGEQLSSIISLIQDNPPRFRRAPAPNGISDQEIAVPAPSEEPKDRIKRLEARISNAVEHGNLKDGRLIILSAQAPEQLELKTIFVSDTGSIKSIIEHPPILRHNGWSMETLDQAKIQRGEYIRVGNGARKVIDLYRDGTMIFAGKADSTFLAWGRGNSAKINPLAFIEVVYSFVNLYQQVLTDFATRPQTIVMRIDLRNMHHDGAKSYLLPHGLKSTAQAFEDEKQEAPDNNWHIERTFSTDNFSVAAIAYDLAREVYLWFGHEETKIPYQKIEGGTRMIDTDAIIHSG